MKLFNYKSDLNSCLKYVSFKYLVSKCTLFYIEFASIIRVNFFFVFFRAAPIAYGGSQGRGPIGAIAANLHQGHSNTGSEPHL